MITRAKTTTEFIHDANNAHNYLYDYSLVDYKNGTTKVKIICQKHGIFLQRPQDHINSKNGCPKCAGKIKKTTKEFIQEAVTTHGDLYDYSLVNYISNKSKVKIICKKHGVFEQIARYHLKGAICRKCSRKEKLSFDEFKSRAIQTHGNLYDYSKVEYKSGLKKVDIICKIHGIFKQEPFSHFKGDGCPKCSKLCKLSTEEFVKRSCKVHNNKYKYDKSKYINSNTKLIIICSNHGEFKQFPQDHMRGNGCPKCANNYLSEQDFFNKAIEIHEGKFNYNKVNYVNLTTKIILTCKIHGDFIQSPCEHLRGRGCKKCSNSVSKLESKWLDSLNIKKNNRQVSLPGLPKRWKVDGYDPSINTVYEFHGDFWHGNPKIYDPDDINDVNKKTFGELYKNTINRENMIKNAGYNLNVMWENEWNSLL